MAVDPICGMEVDETVPLKAEFEGKSYYFCSIVCKNVFEKEPHRYAAGSNLTKGGKKE